MLKHKVTEEDTKTDIVEYLQSCKCPSLKKLFRP